MTPDTLTRRAYRKASNLAFAAAIAGRITADEYHAKLSRLWAAFEHRRDSHALRGFMHRLQVSL